MLCKYLVERRSPHGLRVSELVSLRWSQFDLKHGLFHVVRHKNGIGSPHPLYGVEMRALQKMKRENPGAQFVFLSERNAPMTDSAFRKMLYRTGEAEKLGLPVHPHMLRHSCGFKLANDGQDTRIILFYLGHKNIQNTVPYTRISPNRFKGFWKD
jgi:type 1 fimbriae regulatory protein FimB/type 1 fimbriae regulatory protein FimE